MPSCKITQYIKQTNFKSDMYLKICMSKYFHHRTLPNVKLLTLNDTIYVLNYLGCSFDGCEISTFVKLALRLKNLMKATPQSIPIKKDQSFEEWYNIFLKQLKSQIQEKFKKIKTNLDEKETLIEKYLVEDKSIMRKCISVIEREIINFPKNIKKSDNVDDELSTNETENSVIYSSEDDEPLANIILKVKASSVVSANEDNSSEKIDDSNVLNPVETETSSSDNLTSETPCSDTLISDHSSTNNLEPILSSTDNLTPKTLNIENLTPVISKVKNLTPGTSNIENLTPETSNIENLTSETSNIGSLTSETSNIGNLTSETSNIGNSTSETSNIENLTPKLTKTSETRVEVLLQLNPAATDLETGDEIILEEFPNIPESSTVMLNLDTLTIETLNSVNLVSDPSNNDELAPEKEFNIDTLPFETLLSDNNLMPETSHTNNIIPEQSFVDNFPPTSSNNETFESTSCSSNNLSLKASFKKHLPSILMKTKNMESKRTNVVNDPTCIEVTESINLSDDDDVDVYRMDIETEDLIGINNIRKDVPNDADISSLITMSHNEGMVNTNNISGSIINTTEKLNNVDMDTTDSVMTEVINDKKSADNYIDKPIVNPINEIINLDDDDDDISLDAMDTNTNNYLQEVLAVETPASFLENFANELSKTEEIVHKPTTSTINTILPTTSIDNEINQNETENIQDDSDIVINSPPKFLIDKQLINSIPFRTFITKARSIYRTVKSPFIDDFFHKYCKKHGNLPLPPQKLLLQMLGKSFVDVNFFKKIEIYTDITLNVVKFCVENAPQLLEFTFADINRDNKLYNDVLNQFKSMLKYMLYYCLEKLQSKLKALQRHTSDTIITPEDVKDLAISFTVPSEPHFKVIRLLSQSNIIDIKYSPLPKQGLTMKQLYNFPGVTVKCQFTDIVFGRINISNYKSFVTLISRKDPIVVNKRIIGDKKLKVLEENEKDVALSTKYLMNYFHDVILSFQEGQISGIKYLRDVCSEFLKDIDYISPSRKAMVMNSEHHCSLNNYGYVVAANNNNNRLGLKHKINPEVKVFLTESENSDQCMFTLICNICNTTFEAFDNELTVKFFTYHLIRVHGYFTDTHTCIHCSKEFSFQEILNKRWAHECYM